MTIKKRLDRLERNRLFQSTDALELDLSPDLCRRIDAAHAAGAFPHGLCADDLMTIVNAADVARGRT